MLPREGESHYGATVQEDPGGSAVVNYGGIAADDFVALGQANAARGYGAVPIGRLDPHRPSLAPHKTAWCRGYHGYNAITASASEIEAMPERILRRIVSGRERGILNLGARLPVGLVGEDRDNYGTKHGAQTIAEHEHRLGRRQPTYFVTARGFDSGSGIFLYGGVPADWAGVGVLQGGGVETIQPHLRYLAAPGSLHHTERTYRLYHEANGPTPLDPVLPKLDDPDLAPYPDSWLSALFRKPRPQGVPVSDDDVAAFAAEYTFDEYPSQLDKTILDVLEATSSGQTRPAFHRALGIAARKSRAGCYPWARAVEEIRAAAVAAYAERGEELDPHDFARSVQEAVTKALDMCEDEVARWGGDYAQDVERPSRRLYTPRYRPAYRPRYRAGSRGRGGRSSVA